jgi:hypothetical protein
MIDAPKGDYIEAMTLDHDPLMIEWDRDEESWQSYDSGRRELNWHEAGEFLGWLPK